MLSGRARRRLEAHLDSCEACRQELAELRVTVEALGSLSMFEVPRSFALAAAPVAEVWPRPTARRLEFGLRLATATVAFALALVVIGDFAGLAGEGEKEMPAASVRTAEDKAPGVQGGEGAFAATPAATGTPAPEGTPASIEWAATATPALKGTPVPMGGTPAATPAVEETPTGLEAPPVGTPPAEETPGVIEGAPPGTPTEVQAVPLETPPAAETPAAEGTPAALVPGYAEVQSPTPEIGAGVSEDEGPDKGVTERAGVEEEAEAGAAYDQAAAEAQAAEEGGGLSREEAVRWLEVGLGAGVGVLAALWAFARFQTSIRSRA
jgi:hypothetical protein